MVLFLPKASLALDGERHGSLCEDYEDDEC